MNKLDRTGCTTAVDKFPRQEDWNYLGGEPRVFCNPDKLLNSRWIVLQPADDKKSDINPGAEFKERVIIPTVPPKGLNIKFVDISLDGLGRVIRIPSFMDHTKHGKPCEGRSRNYGGSGYDRLRTEKDYNEYIRSLGEKGLQELKYVLRDGKPKLEYGPIDMSIKESTEDKTSREPARAA